MRKPLQRLYLLYHELRPGGSPYSYVMGTEMFERQMDLFVQLRESAESAVACGPRSLSMMGIFRILSLLLLFCSREA